MESKEDKSLKYESDIISIVSVIVCFAIVAVCVFVMYYKTKDYSYRTTATLIDEYNVNDSREVIGYTDTYYAKNTAVYDRPAELNSYHATYSYEYDGFTYTFEEISPYSNPKELVIYVNPDDPSKVVLESHKVKW